MKGYTTQDKKQKNPEEEKDKTIITTEAYALREAIENLTQTLDKLRISFLR